MLHEPSTSPFARFDVHTIVRRYAKKTMETANRLSLTVERANYNRQLRVLENSYFMGMKDPIAIQVIRERIEEIEEKINLKHG